MQVSTEIHSIMDWFSFKFMVKIPKPGSPVGSLGNLWLLFTMVIFFSFKPILHFFSLSSLKIKDPSSF